MISIEGWLWDQIGRKAVSQFWDNWVPARWLGGKNVAAKETDFDRLAARLQYLLEWHRISGLELLYFAKSSWNWTAEGVGDTKRLASLMGSEQMEWLSSTFGIERAWLDGREKAVACPLPAYKNLDQLPQYLEVGEWLHSSLKMTIVACGCRELGEPLDRYAIVFSRQILSDHDDAPEVYRHVLLDTVWPWQHWPARRDTKAIARWYSMEFHHFGQIPIVPIGAKDFKDLVELKVSPGKFVPEVPVGYEFFEDRVLLERESRVAIPSSETEKIIHYLRESGLLAALPSESRCD
ncbi:hypothetical protein AB1L30_08765 [Bremerella sp. JC817]|uniref:hypothetical protein n=1 Tax=Bremerella sp. JC817 TaxID=3231756 RepID=UPI003459C29E